MKRLTCILLVLGVSLVILSGCSSLKSYMEGYVDIAKERGISKEYLTELSKWTRDQTAYSEFETKFHISATYRSDDFNRAYLKEQARLLQLSETDRNQRDAILCQADGEFTEFFFYAYTAEVSANDFGMRQSMWRVFLLDEQGRHIVPLEIRRIDRDKVTPLIETFFPYVQKYYGYCYHLKFPRQSSKSMRLMFVSYLGKIELDWKP
ncbi:MAG: hypothetical protein CSYNP_01236 [Syntrophus sp. SKADARSKE-3]|nr:hypothetical protein [Syntrophus sp. SKADARSKE-3]